MEAGGPVGEAVHASRQRLECVRFHRRFGFGAPAAVGRGLTRRGEGKAVLQARAVQTLARLLTRHSEPRATVPPEVSGASEPGNGIADRWSSRLTGFPQAQDTLAGTGFPDLGAAMPINRLGPDSGALNLCVTGGD